MRKNDSPPGPTLIVVSGPPASGKTTVAKYLSESLGPPVFHKDALKERLGDSLGCETREESQRLGVASIFLLYEVVETVLKSGASCVIEMNFRAEYDTPRINHLIEAYDCRAVQVYCRAPDHVMRGRYVARGETGQRHPVHFDEWIIQQMGRGFPSTEFAALPIAAPTVVVDTENFEGLNLARLASRVARLIDANGHTY